MIEIAEEDQQLAQYCIIQNLSLKNILKMKKMMNFSKNLIKKKINKKIITKLKRRNKNLKFRS